MLITLLTTEEGYFSLCAVHLLTAFEVVKYVKL